MKSKNEKNFYTSKEIVAILEQSAYSVYRLLQYAEKTGWPFKVSKHGNVYRVDKRSFNLWNFGSEDW